MKHSHTFILYSPNNTAYIVKAKDLSGAMYRQSDTMFICKLITWSEKWLALSSVNPTQCHTNQRLALFSLQCLHKHSPSLNFSTYCSFTTWTWNGQHFRHSLYHLFEDLKMQYISFIVTKGSLNQRQTFFGTTTFACNYSSKFSGICLYQICTSVSWCFLPILLGKIAETFGE